MRSAYDFHILFVLVPQKHPLTSPGLPPSARPVAARSPSRHAAVRPLAEDGSLPRHARGPPGDGGCVRPHPPPSHANARLAPFPQRGPPAALWGSRVGPSRCLPCGRGLAPGSRAAPPTPLAPAPPTSLGGWRGHADAWGCGPAARLVAAACCRAVRQRLAALLGHERPLVALHGFRRAVAVRTWERRRETRLYHQVMRPRCLKPQPVCRCSASFVAARDTGRGVTPMSTGCWPAWKPCSHGYLVWRHHTADTRSQGWRRVCPMSR
jgi:hypothetical protein